MRKAVIFGTLAAAVVLLAGSCTRENLVSDQSGDEATISIALGLENAAQTRAISDGTGANSLYYAVYDEDGVLVDGDHFPVEKVGTVSFPTTESVTLAKGKTYQIAFWAQNSECDAYTLSYDDGMSVTVDYENALNNDETRDAFFAAVSVYVIGNSSLSVGLKRPFAQVNVGVTQDDWDAAVADDVVVQTSKVTFGPVADVLNLLDGSVEVSSEDPITLDLNDIPDEYLYVDIDGDGEKNNDNEKFVWLSMSYILAPDTTTGSESTLTGADFYFYNSDTGYIELIDGLDNLPVQRNWRTNILGTILSGVVDFNIYIDPDYDGDISENIADGVVYYEQMNTYAISTAKGLEWLSDHVNGTDEFGTNDAGDDANDFYGYTVVLADNIDLDGIEWIPIGTTDTPFLGTFDGNGNTISNLTVTMSTSEDDDYDAALFGYTGGAFSDSSDEHYTETCGSVKNLTINNATITGYQRVGVIAAYAGYADFSDINITGDVKVEGNAYVGTIVGRGPYGDLTNIRIEVNSGSYVKAVREEETQEGDEATQHDYVGGAIGWTAYGEHYRTNIWSNIDVSGHEGAVGGISGNSRWGNHFENCYSEGNIEITNASDPDRGLWTGDYDKAGSMAYKIGGIAGDWENTDPYAVYFDNCSFGGTLTTNQDEDEYVNLWANVIVGEKYQQTTRSGAALMIDGKSVTTDRTVANVTIITLDDVTYYAIHNLAGLKAYRDAVNDGEDFSNYIVLLTDDIDLNNEEWEPIGTSENHFKGTFDGGGYTISNLTITGTDDYVGLFGYTNDETAEVKNLTLKNATVSGNEGVGTVFGRPWQANLTDITVTGTIVVEGEYYVGGVAGGKFVGTLTNITVDADASSSVTGNRTYSGTDPKHTYVGGIVGYINSNTRNYTHTNLVSNIKVNGANGGTGGISGNITYGNNFANCTCTGDVAITSAIDSDAAGTYDEDGDYADQIGGIVGVWVNADGYTYTFTNCTFSGDLSVTGKDYNPDVDLSDNTIIGGKHYVNAGGTLIIDGVEQ